MEYLTLILAIIAVESGGNDLAIGYNGMAYGCLHIHACYVQDAAEYANQPWTHRDAYDREVAIQIFTAYMSRYATAKRLGEPVTAEHIARIHNGGPNGHLKPATEKYWLKVKAVLESHGYDTSVHVQSKNLK